MDENKFTLYRLWAKALLCISLSVLAVISSFLGQESISGWLLFFAFLILLS